MYIYIYIYTYYIDVIIVHYNNIPNIIQCSILYYIYIYIIYIYIIQEYRVYSTHYYYMCARMTKEKKKQGPTGQHKELAWETDLAEYKFQTHVGQTLLLRNHDQGTDILTN